MIARLLFGRPGCWTDRHQGTLVAVIVLIIIGADTLVSIAQQVLA